MATILFSGSPGSGKSLHAASLILQDLSPRSNKFVIANFPINLDCISPIARDRFKYIPSALLKDTDYIMHIIEDYWSSHTAKSSKDAESRIHFYWDECQLQLNSRTWLANQKAGWPAFFQLHRHLGVKVILMCQMQSMLDKQIRGIIEYDVVHRKVSNGGLGAAIFSMFTFNRLFVSCYIWNTTRKQFSSDFFLYTSKLGKLYCTHSIFSNDSCQASIIKIVPEDSYIDKIKKIVKNIPCVIAQYFLDFSEFFKE